MLYEFRARLTDARDRTEHGFTLIELMVVVLIIAIWIAIAIPTFCGARQKAPGPGCPVGPPQRPHHGQDGLRRFPASYSADVADGAWASIEPSLDWVSGPSTTSAQISTKAAGVDTVILANYAASGRCWYLKDSTGAVGANTAGTFYESVKARRRAVQRHRQRHIHGDPRRSGTTTGSAWP